jgi:protein-tyrosine-phosphatase
MSEKGLDITGHRSRKASDLDLISYDYIYCVEEVLSQQLVALGAPKEKVQVVEVSNPYGQDLETYRACAAILSKLAEMLASKLNQ